MMLQAGQGSLYRYSMYLCEMYQKTPSGQGYRQRWGIKKYTPPQCNIVKFNFMAIMYVSRQAIKIKTKKGYILHKMK